jgi:hypothetical protein
VTTHKVLTIIRSYREGDLLKIIKSYEDGYRSYVSPIFTPHPIDPTEKEAFLIGRENAMSDEHETMCYDFEELGVC